MKWIKLAFRNVLRNKRRSFITMIAIGVGFASISLYHGYIHNAYEGLRSLAMYIEGLGHLRINKAGWQTKGKLEPEKYMFSHEETEKIMKLVREEKSVRLVTPQINVTGLVTNGELSTVFIAQGVVPEDERNLMMSMSNLFKYVSKKYLFTGEQLSDVKISEAVMSWDLARYLNFKPGSSGIVLAQTLNGNMNALDVQISGVYNTGNDFSNDKFMKLNFYFAQSLLDCQSAERIMVVLKDWRDTERMRDHLLKKLRDVGIDCEIRTWNKLSLYYSKIKSYLDKIFMFLSSIVLVIVVMTTINTMGMAIIERTKEIGTLRALGLKFRGVSVLFAMEGAFLGVFGSVVGIILHICVWTIIKIYPFYYTPPGLSGPIPMLVDMVPEALFFLVLCFMVLSTFAAIIPAKGAAKKNIVDALGHV
ncbi:MAG: ABC transporter permease [Syntrophaceae bacterium]|nr:ABC transporter permease [Syntrophaceae bacterium]